MSAQLPPEYLAKGDVSVGYVTGDEYPDYEAALIKDGSAQYPLLGRHIVRVTFVAALKGPLLGPMSVETSCYDRKPSSGDRVLVYYQSGRYFVQPSTSKYETDLKAAIARHHEP